ncbi:Transcriptional regulator [Acetobacteraceae bacterium EV16G]|uniref:Transcriptional regulator n=1 Tax=Sorlinia euscelidii TaxID=3081148 RepID=A0ABU7TYU2_9PROT
MITRDHLQETGEALFGPRWQSELASALGVNVRTVQRWISGKNPLPDWLAKDLAELVTEHRDRLDEIAGRIAT